MKVVMKGYITYVKIPDNQLVNKEYTEKITYFGDIF